MVDWSLARQIARFAASAGAEPPPLPATDFSAYVAESERHLREYTQLEPVSPSRRPSRSGARSGPR